MHSTPDEIFQSLLKDPAFIAWVLEENAELDQHWKNWAAENCQRKKAIEQARFALLSLSNETVSITDEHIAFKIRQALERAKRREKGLNRNIFRNKFSIKTVWLAAASIVLILTAGINFFLKSNTKSLFVEHQQQFVKRNEIIEVSNVGQNPKYVQLPDGSSVVLQANSRISYTKQFDSDKRVVILSGEAFFEIAKDPERPFFVYANELVTKVLGTSFSIRAAESGDNILVAVKTGKVSVFKNKDQHADDYKNGKKLSALLLSPNEQAYFERKKSTLTRSSKTGSALLKIPIENQNFIYNETSVSEVFLSLEKAYGIDIVYNEKTMAHCSVTATLGDEPLDNKLKWICTILEAEYSINDTKVTITGNACQ